MSHFSVLVRLPSSLSYKEVSTKCSGDGSGKRASHPLVRALAPFQENNMGDCPKEYLTFHDREDESREKYETGGTDMIRCPDGSLVYTWDDRFRVSGQFGIGTNTHKIPDDHCQVYVPHKDRFATFELYMREWEGYSKGRDAETNRYGYWENPNKKWDWWEVGGRWRGDLPVKAGALTAMGELGTPEIINGERPRPPSMVDLCRISDLDKDKIAELHTQGLEKNWQDWLNLIEWVNHGILPLVKDEKTGKMAPDRWFDWTVRGAFLDYGLLICKEKASVTSDERASALAYKEWHRKDSNGQPDLSQPLMVDMCFPITKDEFTAKFSKLLIPFRPYAFMDATGEHPLWIEPGRMGWFGCSSAEPNDRLAYAEVFAKWLWTGDPNDWIVMVDCHI